MSMESAEKDLEYVMDKYGRTVNGIICSMLRSHSERDDLFQEVFLLYYTKELHFEDEGARRSWLIRTALNLCRSANRSPWNLLRSGEEFDPYSVVDTESLSEDTGLWQKVCGLKEKYRLPVYLHYFEGLSLAEVAEIMQTSEAAVKMRLKRAREKLKIELTKNDDSETEAAVNEKREYI
ncbi:RNA polymerase sigma factor [Ruminococcus albus]|uniref:RNA polymerase sigma-70 factor, ECF subfamily n=1 Tax=Ruminococcus albus TaxID=1264 RepID=A0A1H7J4R1_RUMAL|nr:sigma-70 family RNA polymerase sigma factor [Ruminococcus albus]SEK69658.1 RNA polymerase sigma-70 factor, ECF subfamily [Ruminococcus albus]